MTEKIIIITGATSGLGLETAKKIAKNSKQFHLVIPCRDLKKRRNDQKTNYRL